AWNNVLGFRPTFGVVPDETIDACLPALAVVGPMARSAGDLALLLSVMAGHDPRAPLSSRDDPARFTAPLDRDFRGARVGWLGDCAGHLPFAPGVLEVCAGALAHLAEIGCDVEEARPAHDLEAVW